MTQNLTCEWITPPNLGWLLYSLGDKEIDYLWNCIGEGNKEKVNAHLAGNINSSFPLYDKNEWFFKHTLCPLIRAYGDQFKDIGNNLPSLFFLSISTIVIFNDMIMVTFDFLNHLNFIKVYKT